MRSLAALFACLAAGVFAGYLSPTLIGNSTSASIQVDAEFASFSPRILPDPVIGAFDAVVTVENADASPDSAVRVFWDAHETTAPDGVQLSYLAFEVNNTSARCIAVEANAMTELASAPLPAGGESGIPGTLRVRLRRPYIDLICDGARVLRVVHEGFPRGGVGVGSRNASVSDPAIQPVTSFVFTDDFMRGGDDRGEWQSSNGAHWEVRSLDNPARSSNAFVYQSVGKNGGVSLVGRPYWDSYRAEASVLGTEGGQVGMVAAASELPQEGELPERFCFVRWTANTAAEGDTPAEPGALEIVLVENEETTVLAKREGGYRPGQWYRLGLTLRDCRLQALVDGHELLSAEHPKLSGGCAGLYTKSVQPVEFDDFRVLSLEEESGQAATDISWRIVSGSWSGEGTQWVAQAAEVPAFAVTGRENWLNVRVRAEASGAAGYGVVAAYRDPGEHLACRIDPDGQARLLRVHAGTEEILDEAPAESVVENGVVELVIDRGSVQCGSLAAFLPDLQGGRVGLLKSPATEPTSFGNFSATAVDPPLPVVSINEVFDEEAMMAIWSGVAGDWRSFDHSHQPSGYDQAFWHRARFHGECEIEAALPDTRPGIGKLALSVAKPVVSETKNNGYVLLYQEKEEERTLALMREGTQVAEHTLPGSAAVRRVRLRTTGPYVVVSIDDRPVISWRDSEPLRGHKVAWAEKGMRLPAEDVQIYSHALVSESFNSAPGDWRRAGGVWQVTNRWECDPRWSFMAGMPPSLALKRSRALQDKVTDQAKWALESLVEQMQLLPDPDSQLAALWNKRSFKGDLVAETYLAQMMDQSRGGGNYRNYVKNFCITVAGDGKSLDSGYSCLFGADNNQRSYILRNGEVVASSHRGIPANQNIHHKWFRLRVEKQGNLVQFRAFTQLEKNAPETILLSLSYEDPEPLPGDKVAIWTYDNGILISRVRIAAEHVGEREDPLGTYPAEAPCYYTRKADQP